MDIVGRSYFLITLGVEGLTIWLISGCKITTLPGTGAAVNRAVHLPPHTTQQTQSTGPESCARETLRDAGGLGTRGTHSETTVTSIRTREVRPRTYLGGGNVVYMPTPHTPHPTPHTPSPGQEKKQEIILKQPSQQCWRLIR